MATRDLLSFGEIFKTIPQEITLGKSKEQLQKEDIVEDDETIETKLPLILFGVDSHLVLDCSVMDMLMLGLVLSYLV